VAVVEVLVAGAAALSMAVGVDNNLTG